MFLNYLPAYKYYRKMNRKTMLSAAECNSVEMLLILVYSKNMWSLLGQLNHYTKKFSFFLLRIRNENAKSIIKRKKAKTPSFLAPSKKYKMIKEFRDELRGLKNILNEIKNWNYWENKKYYRKMKRKTMLSAAECNSVQSHAGWRNKRYLRKIRCKFNDFRTKIYILWKTAWLWKR